MCIIIFKEKGLDIDAETFQQAWRENPHGAGFAYWQELADESGGPSWRVSKGHMSLKAFLEAFEPHRAADCVIHFRIATHGHVTPENTHPFGGPDTPTLFHNGVLYGWGDEKLSDTDHFYQSVLKHLPLDSARVELLEVLADATGSKFILLEEDGEMTPIGKFHDYQGLLCSNMSLVPTRKMPARKAKQQKLEYGTTCPEGCGNLVGMCDVCPYDFAGNYYGVGARADHDRSEATGASCDWGKPFGWEEDILHGESDRETINRMLAQGEV